MLPLQCCPNAAAARAFMVKLVQACGTKKPMAKQIPPDIHAQSYKWSYRCMLFRSVQSLSHVWLFAIPWTAARSPPCPSPAPRVYSNSSLLTLWCHPTISSSVIPFSSLQSFPASESFPVSWLFASGGQSIGASALASVIPKNTQDWFPLGWTGWISLQSKGLSRVFSNTTVQKHQFFSAQLSL